MRAARWVLLLVLCFLSCNKETTRPKQQLPEPVANDSPQHAVQRLVGVYEQKRAAEYADMFTSDFTYEFSSSADPDLVTKYSAGWFKSDETESSTHLFQGYTPSGQPFAPAASSINIDFANMAPVDDNDGVDPVTHKFLLTRVDGQVVIPTSPDPTNFVSENNTNVFYLVRGDLAVGLTASQPADTTHWYIYRWVDVTVFHAPVHPTSAPRAPMPGHASTWGRLKAIYR